MTVHTEEEDREYSLRTPFVVAKQKLVVLTPPSTLALSTKMSFIERTLI